MLVGAVSPSAQYGMIDQVSAHVAEGTDTEIGPAAPVERMIDRMVRDFVGARRRVQLPVQGRRWRVVRVPQPLRHEIADVATTPFRRAGLELGATGRIHVGGTRQILHRRHRTTGPRHTLGPDRTIGVDVHFVHRPDQSGLDPFIDQPRVVAGVALVSHLRDDAAAPGEFLEPARFVDGMRERLLHVDMLLEFHCRLGDDRVGVVRCCHDQGLDVLLLVQHLAEISVALRRHELVSQLERVLARILPVDDPQAPSQRAVHVTEVDIAQRDDVLARQVGRVLHSLTAASDNRNVEGVAGRLKAASEHVTGNDHGAQRRTGRPANKLTTADLTRRHRNPPFRGTFLLRCRCLHCLPEIKR